MPSVLIVTPCLNSVKTIDETIYSVVGQAGSFDLHYHVQDGGSSDGTVERLCQWQELIGSGRLPVPSGKLSFSFASARDGGMYDALNRGFSVAAGRDIMAWINADDRLQAGAIQTAVTVFDLAEDCLWLGGKHNYCGENGTPMATLDTRAYSRELLALGLYEGRRLFFVQQEGVFWRRELWDLIGGQLDARLRLAGDFDLWRRFAAHADFVSVDATLGTFRVRPGQASSSMDAYFQEVDDIVAPFKEERERAWSGVVGAVGRKGRQAVTKGRLARYDPNFSRWTIEAKSTLSPIQMEEPTLSKVKQLPGLAVGWLWRRLHE